MTRDTAVDLVFTSEQDHLREVVHRLFTDASGERAVRSTMETTRGFDDDLWCQLGALELTGLGIPEVFDGSACGPVELGIVMEEAGRSLLCAPYLSTMLLAVPALLAAADDAAQADYLPDIAKGSLRATLAWVESSGLWTADAISMPAERHGGSWVVTGEKCFVIDGHTAQLVLVLARTDAGVSLFAVDERAAGLVRTPLQTLDMTRKLARLEFDNVPARLVGEDGQGETVLTAVLQHAIAGLCAEQVGGAQRALDMAVEYAKTRVQFGRTIGSFQAIKHKCADMLLQVECARSGAYYAMWALAADLADAALATHVAKAYCSDAYFAVATENIHIHGGIGFTWEHPAHLYFRRAKSSQLLFGDATFHRERIAQALEI
jgi:alkylation response protein AidB-like acyl-CoA dehydrogenase